MELAVYACRTDVVVFVPAVCLPTREAEDTFGPLHRIATVHIGDEHRGAWRDILAQIERHLFASLPAAQAQLLMESATQVPLSGD